jgi:hypothetical protein
MTASFVRNQGIVDHRAGTNVPGEVQSTPLGLLPARSAVLWIRKTGGIIPPRRQERPREEEGIERKNQNNIIFEIYNLKS